MEKFIDGDIENHEKPSFWDFKGTYDFVDDWFLMGSPYPLLVITAAYLIFVLKLGPEYMKNRRPFQLKSFLLLYNTFQVGLSVVMLYMCLKMMRKIGPIHRTCLTDTNEDKLVLASLTYYYFGCKVTELMDTVLFVLRKKQNQVSFLHVYHHTLMVWNGWVFLKYEPGYWMLFLGTLNCFVHTVMYSYYGLSAYQSLQKYLWWKKYITSLQLIQFGLILMHLTINYFVNECRASTITIVYVYFNVLLFVYLFSSFYKQSYTKNKKIKNGDNGKAALMNHNETEETESKYGNSNKIQNGIKHRSGGKKGNEIQYRNRNPNKTNG